jgi:CHRD domain
MTMRRVVGAALLAGVLVLTAVVPAIAGGGDRRSGGVAFVTLETTLSGANEVPGPGDADGTGVAQVNISKVGVLCFAIAVEGITLPAAAAHIHQAPAGVAGGVVVTLEAPQPFGSGATGVSAGCLTNVSRSLLGAIVGNPDQYYVNVHNADFPAGAVRGQLAGA